MPYSSFHLGAGARRFAAAIVVGLSLASVDAAAQPQPSATAPADPAVDSPADASRAADGEPDAEPGLALKDPEDKRIADRLRTIFSVVDELKQAKVAVEHGVVRLYGTVQSESDKTKARDLAKGLDGVVYVDNDLEVPDDIGSRVDPLTKKFYAKVDTITQKLPLVGLALLVLLPFVAVARLATRFSAPFQIFALTPLVRGIVQRLVATVLTATGVVLALQVLDATALVGAVLGTAGVLGVALGFGFRDIAENYLASILLGIRRPFAVQDLVLVDEHEGKVVRMTMRETILMTIDGNHLRMPNARIFKATIVNFTRNPLRRFHFVVGVGVEESLGDAQRIGNEALADMPEVLDDPGPGSLIEELAASSVSIRFFGWVDQRDHDILKVKSEAIRLVKTALERADVDLPEPIHRLRIERRRADETPRSRETPDRAQETTADTTIDQQIAEDLTADEQNLLS